MMKLKSLSLLFILIIALFIFIVPVSAATEYYVATAADGGSNGNNGSEGNPWLTISYALTQVSSGDTIYVKAGTYTENITLVDGVNLIGDTSGVGTTIDGGASGTVVTATSVGASTELNGFIITNGNSGSGGGGMFNTSSSLTITNCTFEYNQAQAGGGMYNWYGAPTITDCTFNENTGNVDGGGMYNEDSDPIVSNCTFSGNDANNDGGGMYNYRQSSPTVSYCTFTGNSADPLNNRYGGGMYNDNSYPTVSYCTFSGNDAYYGASVVNYNDSSNLFPSFSYCTFTDNGSVNTSEAGGIYNYYAFPTIDNCTFSGNIASYGAAMYNYYTEYYSGGTYVPTITNSTFSNNTAYGGGAIYNDCSCPFSDNCTFSGNTADNYAGAVSNYYSEYNDYSYYPPIDTFPVFSNCTFYGNTAQEAGGAMDNYYSSPIITGCTFTDNSIPFDALYGGGAIDNYYSCATITNCVFSGNEAPIGGALYNYYDETYNEYYGVDHVLTITNCTFTENNADLNGSAMYNDDSYPKITNCILWGDFTDELYDDDVSVPEVSYCNVQGGYSGTGNMDVNPLFVNAPAGDFSLRSDSPCIDAGTDTSAIEYGSVIDDILDIPRPIGSVYDIGAYEVEYAETQKWSPASLLPLQRTLLGQANSLWQCIEPNLATSDNEETLELAAQVQEHMVKATTMINPVLACGGLSQAIAIMEEISDMLSLDCMV